MLKLKSSLVALAVCMPFAASAVVLNGDFESGTASWTTVTQFVSIQDANDYIDFDGINTYSGNTAALFGVGDQSGGRLAQDVVTVANQLYQVSFDYGVFKRPSATTQKQSLFASASPTSSPNEFDGLTVTKTGTRDLAAMMSSYSFTFLATTALTSLQFVDVSVGTVAIDGVLDNVAITAVPEPQTTALMLAGLGALAFLARRRRL